MNEIIGRVSNLVTLAEARGIIESFGRLYLKDASKDTIEELLSKQKNKDT
jgi:hypothetical protein